MTQEEKDLVVKDLCARLPYGTIIRNYATDEDDVLTYSLLEDFEIVGLEYIKPYLRPMSSMTEEEKEEWHNTFDSVYDLVPGGDPDNEDDYDDNWHEQPGIESYDWLNEHHFDYRGLIEKGLALKATENMYQI